jgi:hypothetical protein
MPASAAPRVLNQSGNTRARRSEPVAELSPALLRHAALMRNRRAVNEDSLTGRPSSYRLSTMKPFHRASRFRRQASVPYVSPLSAGMAETLRLLSDYFRKSGGLKH